MRRSFLVSPLIAATLLLGLGHRAFANTIQTFGLGSAVTWTDWTAEFPTLTSTNITHLDNYLEGGLKIFTSGNSWASDLLMGANLDPFHGGGGPGRAFFAIAWANQDWVTIQTLDGKPMYAVEFVYGNTWTTGDVNGPYPWGNNESIAEWQTWKAGSLVSSGSVGGMPLLEMGTVLGFIDPDGFDRLLVRAVIPGGGNDQGLALDNVAVQITVPTGDLDADGDVDGLDLAALAATPDRLHLSTFAAGFGSVN